jgi:hypothetical protein
MNRYERIALWFLVIVAFVGPSILSRAQFTFNRNDGTFAAVGPDGMGGTNGPSIRPQGRLTLVTGSPLMGSSTTNVNTMYYTPSAAGNGVPIWNGTSWQSYAITADLTNVTTDATTNPAAVASTSNYDLFIWNNAGTVTLSRGPVWTNNTTRANALAVINGLFVNTSAITNGPAANLGTYVGSARSSATSLWTFTYGGTASGGTAGQLNVWNEYNRSDFNSCVVDSGVSYTLTASTVREQRASTGMQNNYMVGVIEDVYHVFDNSEMTTVAVAGAVGYQGVGNDITTTMNGFRFLPNSGASATTTVFNGYYHAIVPNIGLHFFAALEAGDGTNANTFNSGNRISCLNGKY